MADTDTTLAPAEAIAKALDALLTALDAAPTAGAAVAYEAVIVRNGRAATDLMGGAGLDAVLARVRADAPDADSGREREDSLRRIW